MSVDERLARLEQAFATLVRLTESASERMDTQEGWINDLGRAQAETNEKLAALVDAQIRTEDALRRLAESQVETNRAVAALTGRVDALAQDRGSA